MQRATSQWSSKVLNGQTLLPSYELECPTCQIRSEYIQQDRNRQGAIASSEFETAISHVIHNR